MRVRDAGRAYSNISDDQCLGEQKQAPVSAGPVFCVVPSEKLYELARVVHVDLLEPRRACLSLLRYMIAQVTLG